MPRTIIVSDGGGPWTTQRPIVMRHLILVEYLGSALSSEGDDVAFPARRSLCDDLDA